MVFDWIIIGGGISGIVLSEILTRENHSVLLIDKDKQLASETTKVFHEWIHTGSLYTLIPDKLTTLKFLLGAIDDILEFYSSFERMNLIPTESGLHINESSDWFSPNYITFKFKRRKRNLPWALTTARSEYLIKQIKKHDWLRRRAGVIDEFKINKKSSIINNLIEYYMGKGNFYPQECSDFTTDSRNILRDLIATSISNGLELSLDNPVIRIENHNGKKVVVCDKSTFKASNVALCAGKNIADFIDVGVKTSYAPIGVVKGLEESAKSFVELDYFPKNCINLITKPGGIGLIGGISFNNSEKAESYIQYVIKEQKKRFNGIEVIGTYLGEKNEITFKDQSRNYLFHIVPDSSGVWAIVPGKFTLGFSLAPEFYRRVYKRNPKKHFKTITDSGLYSKYVSDTLWHELAMIDNKGKNGNDTTA
jgi:hypothetical protein